MKAKPMVDIDWISIDLEFAMASGELWSFDESASTRVMASAAGPAAARAS
jgi:hypothetical protein